MESLGVRILQGLNVTVIGMSITISALISLAFIVILMSKVVNYFTGRIARGGSSGGVGGAGSEQGGGAPQNNGTPQVDSGAGQAGTGISGMAQEAAVGGKKLANNRLVAIFAAAIAFMTGQAVSSIRIVSFKKTGQNSPVWNLQGRSDYISSKL